MTAKERLEQYLDKELPEEKLMFHVSMVLNFLGCSFIIFLMLLVRMNVFVPAMLSVGVLLTVAAIYAERVVRRISWISGGYLFMMFFVLLPVMSYYVPYAIYDFPIYFLAGIFYIALLFEIKRALIFIVANSIIDILCMYNMIAKASDPAVTQAISEQLGVILFCRIIVALFITGTMCGVLIFYRSRILRREIAKSAAMEQQAEQLSYAKDMFLVNVSHEIRTPLNAILGVTELLLDWDTDDRITDSAFHMANSSRALLTLTNELMDFSKLDGSDPVIANKPYYIGDICNDIINVISVRFADCNMELFADIAPDIPEQLSGDEAIVRQLMLNVLNGVVKSMQSGEVYLRIWKEDSDGEQIRLFVEERAEGTFRYSYREQIYQDSVLEAEYDEAVVPLPHRLVHLMGGEMHMEEETDVRKYFFDIRQGYAAGKTLIEKHATEHRRVLFYENTTIQSDIFAGTLRSMGVDFSQVLTDDFFLQECTDSSYTHLMIASERYDSLKKQLEELLNPQSIILIGSELITYDDVLVRTTFARPVNCLNMCALLCGRQSSMIRHVGYKGRFICPDAHVMVVDDNIVNLEVATSFLGRYQAKVSVAASGKECLKMLKNEPADLIFLDYMMPEMDGIDTLKNIRALGDPKMEKVPIIALTANAVSGARKMFLEAGFDEYISKPIERETFERVLRSCLPEDMIVYIADKEKQAEQTA